MNSDGDSPVPPSSGAYAPPAILWEEALESVGMALSCAHTPLEPACEGQVNA